MFNAIRTTLGLTLSVALSSAAAQGAAAHLLVADDAAKKLYVYAAPDFRKTAELDGVKIGTHAGFLPVGGGGVLFVDEGRAELVLLRVGADGQAAVEGRAPVGAPASHIAVTPDRRYAVASSDDKAKTLTVVDLKTFASKSVALPSADPGVALGGDPATVYHRNAEGQFEAYRVADLFAGRVEAAAKVATGKGGHGEGVSHALNRFCSATDAGIECASTASGLKDVKVLPYTANGRSGGRAFFVTMSGDGRTLYSYIRNAPEKDPWQTWQTDMVVADLASDTVTRLPGGPGLIYRFALSAPYLMYVRQFPGGGEASLMDVRAGSATKNRVLATIPLPALSKGPQAGASPWESEGYRVAISPDGRWGFVGLGGDGKVAVIDTEARRVVRTLTVPTGLKGGGCLTVLSADPAVIDTVGR